MAHSLWKVGVELELIAPVGSNRYLLAEAIAQTLDEGDVLPIFHYESEPSKVPGQEIFQNLTLGFEVQDQRGQWVVRCVDDLTIQADLNAQTPPKPGWFRVVSDDRRLLRLVDRHADWERGFPELLEPVAELFGAPLKRLDGGLVGLYDTAGDSIFIGAPLPGERERPCELITAPLTEDRATKLKAWTSLAQSLGFLIPQEGATHLHFDAQPLKSAGAFRALILLFAEWGEVLKALVHTNPRCTRLGPWRAPLIELVQEEGFEERTWAQVHERLDTLTLTKYCDFNILNMIRADPHKDTFEVRILPSRLDVEELLMSVELFEALLRSCVSGRALQSSASSKGTAQLATLKALLKELRDAELLTSEALHFWLKRAASSGPS